MGLIKKTKERKTSKLGKAGKKVMATVAAAGIFAGSIFGLVGCKNTEKLEANTNNQSQQQQLDAAQQKQIDELLKNYEELEKRVGDLEANDETLLDLINTSMETLQSSITTLSQQIGNNANNQDVSGQISDLQTTISTMQQKLETLDGSNSTSNQEEIKQIKDNFAKINSGTNRLFIMQSAHTTFDSRFNSVHSYGDFVADEISEYTYTSPEGIEIGLSDKKNGSSYIVEDGVAYTKINGEEQIQNGAGYGFLETTYKAIAGWDEYEVTSKTNYNGQGDDLYSINYSTDSNFEITINHGYITSITNSPKDGSPASGWNINEISKTAFDGNFALAKSSIKSYDVFKSLTNSIDDTFDAKYIQLDLKSNIDNATIVTSSDKTVCQYGEDFDCYENGKMSSVYHNEDDKLVKNERETQNWNSPNALGKDLILLICGDDAASTIKYEDDKTIHVVTKRDVYSWDMKYILDEEGKITEIKVDYNGNGNKQIGSITINKLTKKEFEPKFQEIKDNMQDYIAEHETTKTA